jgi:hypothetical protein
VCLHKRYIHNENFCSVSLFCVPLQEAVECGCTAVCCTSDGTIFVGDANGSVWVLGSTADGATSHGCAVSRLGAKVRSITAEADRLIVATSGCKVCGFRYQDGTWALTSEVCPCLLSLSVHVQISESAPLRSEQDIVRVL